MAMNWETTLIDNEKDETKGYMMTHVLKECISLSGIQTIRIATGYWDMLGISMLYDEINAFLEKPNAKLCILIGKDPYVYSGDIISATEKGYDKQEKAILLDLNGLELTDPYNNVVQMLVKHIQSGKIEVHIYNPEAEVKDQFFHAKCYIFDGLTENGSGIARGIIGSSNFTKKGLEGNSELNVLSVDYAHIMSNIPGPNKTHDEWFKEKWEHSVEWEKEFLKIVGESKHAHILDNPNPPTEDEHREVAPLTPYETYIKYLQMHYGNIVDASVKEQLISYLPEKYDALEFQLDAVTQCFEKLRDYKGFFLADVVGLGKTVVGLMIVKKFIEEAETVHHRKPNVLIVTPPAIKSSWEETIEKFDKNKPYKIADHITFVTTGSIGSLVDEEQTEEVADYLENELLYDEYGLILVDESHNFRNSETQKYGALKGLIESITIRSIQPYVGLLSATPQNNSPRDLKNQIYLFQLNPGDSDFELGSEYGNKLDSYFVDKQQVFEACRNDNSDEAKEALKELATDIRQHILEHIVVRRTRSDIKTTYGEDAAKLKFPTVLPPHKLEYEMDDELVELFANTVNTILAPQEGEPAGTEHLGYHRYCAIMYFADPANTKLYEKRNLTVASISARIAKIMRILLVKRIESSFSAFTKSLENLYQYTENMLTMIKEDCVFICPDLDVNKIFADNDFVWSKTCAAIRKKIAEKGGNNREFRAKDFKPEYRTNLEEDLRILRRMCKEWNNNSLDPKKDAFHSAIESQLFADAINNPSGKNKKRLVVFTEAKDTQKEIARYLNQVKDAHGNHLYRVLDISAENRKDKQQDIKENFDANSEVQKDEYNVIVTTEVLAEGVNLHRSNVILNYDTPWNATRLMQRIGRVNRIGSAEEEVHVFNFFPTPQSNSHIHLIEKAYAKLQAFHTMFGEDNQIYSLEEEVNDANFNHIVDGENTPDAVFVKELRDYQTAHPDRYQQIVDMQPENLGGQMASRDESFFVVDAEHRNRSCFICDSEGTIKHVMPLVFMEHLRCLPEDTFTSLDNERYAQTKEEIMKVYSLMLNKTKNAKDARKRMVKALEKIKSLRDQNIFTTDEAKRALVDVETAVRSNNSAAIRMIENYDPQTLFGPDEDINLSTVALFQHIAAQAAQKYGDPYVALFSL